MEDHGKSAELKEADRLTKQTSGLQGQYNVYLAYT